MQTRKLAISLACVVACAGLACQKRVKTSTFVVPFNYGGDLTASSGGTFRWVSESAGGPYFSIHFVTATPCKEGADIPGTPTKAAVCHVLPHSDGLYRYQIWPKGATKEVMKDVHMFDSHVDGCNGCNGVNGNPTGGNNNGSNAAIGSTIGHSLPIIVLACGATGSPAVADPPSVPDVTANEILEWSQDGNASNTWQVTLQDDICTNGKSFGTQQPNAPVACNVKSDVQPGTYSYSITMKNCATPPGSAQLTVTSR